MSTTNEPIKNPYDPKATMEGLNKTIIPMNLYGATFRDTCSNLEKKLEDLFRDSLHITETDHVFIYPVIDERGAAVEQIKCYVYFDTSMPGAKNITKNGIAPSGNNERRMIFDYVPGRSAAGEFQFSEDFKRVFTPIAVLDDEGKLSVRKMAKDKRVACMELDFFLAMALVLGIDEDSPYNFTVLAVDSTKSFRGDYEDVAILMMKYIDTKRRSGRNKNRGRKIDYRSMDRELMGGGKRGRDY